MTDVLLLTRLNGPTFALNPDLIERAEATPDTVITLVNGGHYVIRETLAELTEAIQNYRADIVRAAQSPSPDRPPSPPDGTHLRPVPGPGRKRRGNGQVIQLHREK